MFTTLDTNGYIHGVSTMSSTTISTAVTYPALLEAVKKPPRPYDHPLDLFACFGDDGFCGVQPRSNPIRLWYTLLEVFCPSPGVLEKRGYIRFDAPWDVLGICRMFSLSTMTMLVVVRNHGRARIRSPWGAVTST